MDGGAPASLRLPRGVAGVALGVVLAFAVPAAVTLVAITARTRFDFPFLFLFVPGILFIAYLSGLLAGVLSAVASTLSALYFLVADPGFTIGKVAVHGLPASLFLLVGILMALAGDQYRRYQEQLHLDLLNSRKRTRQEMLLARVAETLASDLPPAELARAVCRETAEVLGDAAALLLHDPDADEFRLAGAHGSAADADGAAWHAGGGEHVYRQALQAARPVLIRRQAVGDEQADEGAAAWLAALEAEAALVAPVRLGEERFGVLAVCARRAREWRADELRVAQTVGERVAGALDRSRRIEQRAERERNAQMLADIMIEFFQEQDVSTLLDKAARRCTETLSDWCGVYVLAPDSSRMQVGALHHRSPASMTRLRAALQEVPPSTDDPRTVAFLKARRPVVVAMDDPLVMEILRQSSALEEARVGTEIASVLAVPVFVGNEALGVLVLGDERRRRWSDDDTRLASAIADRMGAAVQYARLLEAERRARASAEREARRVNAVNRIIAIATRSLDLGQVFDEFADALQLLLPFARLTVSLYDHDRDVLTVPYFKGPELGLHPGRLDGPAEGTARGWVLNTGRPHVRADTMESAEFIEDGLLASAGVRSYAVVPMSVGGRVIGTLEFGHHEPGFYADRHVSLIQPIADHLAITLAHSQLFQQVEHRAGELSGALQRMLLPADLPRPPFVALAATYRPADPAIGIGGDWYDAVLLPDDTLMIGIGDVTGRGPIAAVGMGQVRDVTRAFAVEGRPPAQILTSVNDFLYRMAGASFLSAWVGILDPFEGTLVYAGAGHPPACLVAAGQVHQLAPGGPPLGVSRSSRYGESRILLAPGTRLIAYTDGLIEATRDITEGERRLHQAALVTMDRAPHHAVETLVDQVLDGAKAADDIAVLMIDLLPVEAPLTMSVEALPENLRRIRRAVRALARRHQATADQVEAVAIAVGEAALNAVEHAYRGGVGKLTVHGEGRGGLLTVSVRDYGLWRPPAERGRGRGTRIMAAFAESVKTTTGPSGTRVDFSWTLT